MSLAGENLSLVHQLGESLMDEIIQFGPFPEDQKLLLLSGWFDNCTEKADSPTEFEEAVGRLIDHICIRKTPISATAQRAGENIYC